MQVVDCVWFANVSGTSAGWAFGCSTGGVKRVKPDPESGAAATAFRAASIQHVHDGVVLAGPDVQDGRSWTGPVEGQLDGASHVLDVGEVTALAAVAIDRERLTVGEAASEGLQCEEAEVVEPGVETPPGLAVELRQCVRAEGGRGGRFPGRKRRVRAMVLPEIPSSPLARAGLMPGLWPSRRAKSFSDLLQAENITAATRQARRAL